MTDVPERQYVSAGLIFEPGTLSRPVNKDRVNALAESIKTIGLINPIVVQPRVIPIRGVEADAYQILAGVHRFRAMTRVLCMMSIPVVVITPDSLHAELITIDENLIREDLSKVDRARQLKRRKEIYEELHPETRASASGGTFHGNQVTGSLRRNCDGLPGPPRFTKDTADNTGRSERSVQQYVAIADKCLDEALDLVRGTRLETTDYLNMLKNVSQDDQVGKVKWDLEHLEDVPEARGTRGRKKKQSVSAPRGSGKRKAPDAPQELEVTSGQQESETECSAPAGPEQTPPPLGTDAAGNADHSVPAITSTAGKFQELVHEAVLYEPEDLADELYERYTDDDRLRFYSRFRKRLGLDEASS